jgi:hypothetical protein
LAPPDFLIPSLDQRSPFADWTVSPRCIPVNRGFSVSAIGYKTGFNINSPATGVIDGPCPEALPKEFICLCEMTHVRAKERLTKADHKWLKACGVAWEREPAVQFSLDFCEHP